MKKRCIKCGDVKFIDEFHIHESSKDGLAPLCKKCTKEYNKEYWAKNKDKFKERGKEYRAKNKDKLKEYRAKNKDKFKEYRAKNKDKLKEYRAKNKDKFKEHRAKNKDKFKEYKKEGTVKLSNVYVKGMLRTSGIKKHQITPELIELKKQQILLYREIKNIKGDIKNGTT